ncbi:tetratricopeptide repeat protein [Pseudalkalibacillus berkeleyi]|uniref:Tetratricopeptide repeat protein n=1 Tax=Pseudalkalibacillus berkeleyi TaxID=1069813 RepID=A0ABS9H3M9_9BACL|nr:tetratricopeptide repeat protein [Pseudalkalibacillus berkeleyi]MCF6138686.1 tetratricopeptide repeat protein [Pseudalkalibacillus berkeleyi]
MLYFRKRVQRTGDYITMKLNQSASRNKGKVIPFSRSGEYYFQRGLKAYQKKDLVKAKHLFQRAVDVDPKEATYLCQLAATLAELGDFMESNDLLEYVVSEIDAEISECYYFMANNYAHLGMFREAESEAVRYMENEPDGEFYEESEELLDLIHSEFGEDLENRPTEERLIVHHEKARRSLEKGQFEEARDLLKQMVQNHPEFWAAYNNLALAHFYLGEYKDAFSVLDDILDENPGNLHALCNAALFYKQLQQQKETDQFVRILRVIHPIIPEHRYKLGSTFALLEENELAFLWLHSVRKQGYAWNETYFHWLAVASLKTGRKKAAEWAWEKILDLQPESTVAKYYLEKLEEYALQPDYAEYQYTIPVKSYLESGELTDGIQKLRGTIHKNKLSHLLLIRKSMEEEDSATLEAFCGEIDESLLMKELAATVLFENGYEQVEIQEDSGIVRLEEPPVEMINGLKILDLLLGSDNELNADTAFLWYLIMEESKNELSISLNNNYAWSAAIDYFVDKLGDKNTSQKQVASQYGISVSTLGKYVKILRSLYEKQSETYFSE